MTLMQLITSAEALFLNKATSTAIQDEDFNKSFGEDPIEPIINSIYQSRFRAGQEEKLRWR